MKITQIETIRIDEHPNVLWVQIYTDNGYAGLGETFLGAAAVEAYLHETAADILLGREPLAIESIHSALTGYLGLRSSGAEMRGVSAINIALWDLYGRVVNQPIYQLLGGQSRDVIRTYNTCAGPHYIQSTPRQKIANWGLERDQNGRYDDLDAFLNRADELAEDLLDEGITAMKIWPFDPAAEDTDGLDISLPALKQALEPFEKIRKTVGDRMEIMVEFHSLWHLTPAIRIAQALGPYKTYWHEDPIRMDSLGSLTIYAEQSLAPVCASETLAGQNSYRDLLATNAAGIVMFDISWCGGLTEARKIAAMADAWHLPVTGHDCTGPVVLTASTHLCLHAPNALLQESVRAFHRTWYRDAITEVPPIKQGHITVPSGPGLGLNLNPKLDRVFTVKRKLSNVQR